MKGRLESHMARTPAAGNIFPPLTLTPAARTHTQLHGHMRTHTLCALHGHRFCYANATPFPAQPKSSQACPTLMPPLPMSVAPKNSQKGIRKWPQQMPHRSKAALG